MKITFDCFEGDNPNCRLFKTKQEWDECEYSSNYHHYKKKYGTYQEKAYNEPYKFPCIAIFGDFAYNSNGADYQHFTYLYDFKIEE